MTGAPSVVTASGFLSAGQVQVRGLKRLHAQMGAWPDGCELLVTFERVHATRSLAQNRYYHGVVINMLAAHTGYTHDDTHELMKQRFNGKDVLLSNAAGEVIGQARVGLSTARLNKIQFGEYLDSVIQFAAELGCVIPDATAAA